MTPVFSLERPHSKAVPSDWLEATPQALHDVAATQFVTPATLCASDADLDVDSDVTPRGEAANKVFGAQAEGWSSPEPAEVRKLNNAWSRWTLTHLVYDLKDEDVLEEENPAMEDSFPVRMHALPPETLSTRAASGLRAAALAAGTPCPGNMFNSPPPPPAPRKGPTALPSRAQVRGKLCRVSDLTACCLEAPYPYACTSRAAPPALVGVESG